MDVLLHGALAATRAVLPAMREAGAGTLLYTNGAGSVDPDPVLGNLNAAQAALRNWVLGLHKELAGTGVQAAHVVVGAWIGTGGPPGVPAAPAEEVASLYWDLHTQRDEAERVFTVSASRSHGDGPRVESTAAWPWAAVLRSPLPLHPRP